MEPSQWPALSAIHPEIEAVLQADPLPNADLTDPAHLPIIRPIVTEQMKKSIYSRLEFDGIEQSTIEIPMRDGSISRSLLYKSSKPVDGGSPLAVLFHGGGWVLGCAEMEALSAVPLVEDFGCVVVSVEYRLAPEHPFPTPINDCWDALQWCATNAPLLSAEPTQGLLIGGTSSRANFASVLQHLAVRENLNPPVTGTWLAYPPTLTAEMIADRYPDVHTSRVQNAEASSLTTQGLEDMAYLYAADPISELYMPFNWPSHSGLARTFIHICGFDPLRDDGLLYERELRRDGVDVRMSVYPGCPHGLDVVLPGTEQGRRFERERKEAFGWLLGRE